MATVEQRLAGKGAILTEERSAALEPIFKKADELKKMSEGLVKDKLVEKDQFKA